MLRKPPICVHGIFRWGALSSSGAAGWLRTGSAGCARSRRRAPHPVSGRRVAGCAESSRWRRGCDARKPASPDSQLHRFVQHGGADVAVEFVLGNEVERTTSDLRQAFGKRQALREQVVATRKVHQEIDVAVRPFLAASHRAEHADALRAVLVARGKDGVLLSAQIVEQLAHGYIANAWVVVAVLDCSLVRSILVGKRIVPMAAGLACASAP